MPYARLDGVAKPPPRLVRYAFVRLSSVFIGINECWNGRAMAKFAAAAFKLPMSSPLDVRVKRGVKGNCFDQHGRRNRKIDRVTPDKSEAKLFENAAVGEGHTSRQSISPGQEQAVTRPGIAENPSRDGYFGDQDR